MSSSKFSALNVQAEDSSDTVDPVFIVGMPRSGTTLLSSILNAHSQLAIAPETHYFNIYYRRYPSLDGLNNHRRRKDLLTQLFGSAELNDFRLTASAIREAQDQMEIDADVHHATILRRILSEYAQLYGKTRYGEKTPEHLFCARTIWHMFPAAKIICVIRDPRDVSLSWTKIPWNNGNSFNHALTWLKYARASQRHAPNTLFFLEICYEKLLHDPVCTMKHVCRFLSLPFESAMLDSSVTNALKNFNEQREPWKSKNLEILDSTNTEKWRTNMSKADRAVIELIAGKVMTARGYYNSDAELIPSASMWSIILAGLKYASINAINRLARRYIPGVNRVRQRLKK